MDRSKENWSKVAKKRLLTDLTLTARGPPAYGLRAGQVVMTV